MPKSRCRNLTIVQPTTETGRTKVNFGRPQTPEVVRRKVALEAMRELGEVIYAIRMPDDLIKIGHTANLTGRRKKLTTELTAILAVTPGSHEDEQALHRRFRPYVARGREYYHPTPEIVAFINEIRVKAGIPAVDM